MVERSARGVAGRAKVQRDQILAAVAVLTDGRLEELARRGEVASVIDGFKSSTLGDGRGMDGGTSVESAVLRRAGFSPGDDGEDDDLRVESKPDPVAGVLNELFGLIRSMSNQAAAVIRVEENLRFDRELALDPVDPNDPDGVRESSLKGSCVCCGDRVSGVDWDRLRRGLCNRCYHSWRLWAPGEAEPSITRFCVEMRDQLAEEAAEVGHGLAEVVEPGRATVVSGPVSVVTGGFKQGVGEVRCDDLAALAEVVRASSQVNDHVGEVA